MAYAVSAQPLVTLVTPDILMTVYHDIHLLIHEDESSALIRSARQKQGRRGSWEEGRP